MRRAPHPARWQALVFALLALAYIVLADAPTAAHITWVVVH